MSEVANLIWTDKNVRDLVERHFCGPSPDCEERPIFSEEEWGVLKTTAITWGGWNENAHKVLPRTYWNLVDLEVASGDVLVTKAGPRHRVGVVTHVPTTRRQLVVSGKMIGLRPRRDLVEPAILSGLISLASPQKYIQDRTTGMAESQVNFANDVLLNTPLSVPPLVEQHVIARIINRLDFTIRQTEAIIAKLKQVKQGLLHDLLTRGIDANGELRPPQNEAPHFYKQSLLGWIPQEWSCEPLEQLTSKIVDGVHQTPSYVRSGIPFVTVKNLTESRGITFTELSYITPRDHRVFSRRADPMPGDVLVTKDGTLGVARIVRPSYPEFSIFVSVAQLRPISSRLSAEILAAFFESEHYERQLGGLSGGSGLKHIHLEQFRQFLIPLPSCREQVLISERFEAIERRSLFEQSDLTKLKAMKSGLMDDLLTGRVRVTSLLEASSAPP